MGDAFSVPFILSCLKSIQPCVVFCKSLLTYGDVVNDQIWEALTLENSTEPPLVSVGTDEIIAHYNNVNRYNESGHFWKGIYYAV